MNLPVHRETLLDGETLFDRLMELYEKEYKGIANGDNMINSFRALADYFMNADAKQILDSSSDDLIRFFDENKGSNCNVVSKRLKDFLTLAIVGIKEMAVDALENAKEDLRIEKGPSLEDYNKVVGQIWTNILRMPNSGIDKNISDLNDLPESVKDVLLSVPFIVLAGEFPRVGINVESRMNAMMKDSAEQAKLEQAIVYAIFKNRGLSAARLTAEVEDKEQEQARLQDAVDISNAEFLRADAELNIVLKDLRERFDLV